MITIKVDDREIMAVLRSLHARTGNLSPALREIGEELVESTKRRFETSTGPDGQSWPANSPVTLAQHLGRTKGNHDKAGQLTKKGAARVASKKPLIGETHQLSSSIGYRVLGDTLEIGSPMEYAAMQQFGGTRADFPHLWGDIPARPFLGISEADRQNILVIMQKHLNP